MFSKVFIVCLLATSAFAAPQDVVVAETAAPAVVATVEPAVVAAVEPVPVATTVVEEVQATAVEPVAAVAEPLINTCHTETEPLETQTCTPIHKRVCTPIEVINQKVGFEKKCKDVVSRTCPQVFAPFGSTVLVKREADPAVYFSQLGLPHVTYAHHAFRSACHDVTTQHCIDSPIVVEEPATVESCHVISVVECVPVVEQIPKTICDPVETVIAHQPINPLAYHHLAAPYIGL